MLFLMREENLKRVFLTFGLKKYLKVLNLLIFSFLNGKVTLEPIIEDKILANVEN